ncbi:MAG: ABC transporter ATP-binding protein [Lachnospiraceae bacterium]
MKAVTVEHLSKIFDDHKKAVSDISFSLDAGEIFGFLGPNGAGKTTTVKLLNGMLAPSEGSCKVFDIDPFSSPEIVHRTAGVVTEHAQMYDNLTGEENLVLYGALFGIRETDGKKRAGELLDQLELLDAAGKKLGAYSTGMRQRLYLARAMMHNPKILFLDEPTSGLDPESTKSVNTMITQLSQEKGTTVFLCTHQLRYAEEICTCYGLVDNGALLRVGNLAALRATVDSDLTVTIRADNMPALAGMTTDAEGFYNLKVASEHEIPSIVSHLVQEGAKLYYVAARQKSLEEIYFTLLDQQRDREVMK